jgi:hypothetical protein
VNYSYKSKKCTDLKDHEVSNSSMRVDDMMSMMELEECENNFDEQLKNKRIKEIGCLPKIKEEDHLSNEEPHTEVKSARPLKKTRPNKVNTPNN